jgi:hypothetical protein
MVASSSLGIRMLAAAPKGGFHEDKGGWSGASEFFAYPDVGTCSYSVMNVRASNTAAQLAAEDVTYTINKKATILRSSPKSAVNSRQFIPLSPYFNYSVC